MVRRASVKLNLVSETGVADLNPDDVRLDMFLNEEILNDMNVLSAAARCLCNITVR